MTAVVTIGERLVGPGRPAYLIAELSGNHDQSLDKALELVDLAAGAGADAIKIQTYRPDTMTIDSDQEWFRLGDDTLWAGRNLYELYGEAHTPWEWTEPLAARAHEHGVHLFSTPFDATAVEFLEGHDMPAYKIASFELVDLALIRLVAETGKPVIMSTGMATLAEISDAVDTARAHGTGGVALLHCSSAYPSSPADMNLRTITHLAETFGAPAGLSDHTLGIAASVAAVALGACVIEKHFTRSRSEPGPDVAFSLEPAEFAALVTAVRATEQALGEVHYGPTKAEEASLTLRRSLFVVEDVPEGDELTAANVRAIRPGHGLAPKWLPEVLGRRARRRIERGTPLSWDLIG